MKNKLWFHLINYEDLTKYILDCWFIKIKRYHLDSGKLYWDYFLTFYEWLID